MEGSETGRGALEPALEAMLTARAKEVRTGGETDPATGRYRKGFIEQPLLLALRDQPGLAEPERDFEIQSETGTLVTVPDFTWPDARLAVFCDGYAYHGDPATLELDAKKRNWLQSRGWTVLVFWGRTILKDPSKCAAEIAQLYRQRSS
jgi:very-short-patch-repair endonuclease